MIMQSKESLRSLLSKFAFAKFENILHAACHVPADQKAKD